MSLWVTVLASAGIAYALKLAGYLVPTGSDDTGRDPSAGSRIVTLLPVALLAGLLAVQTVGGADGVVLDARIPAVATAVALLLMRANFLLVVVAAAAVAALLRALGWAS